MQPAVHIDLGTVLGAVAAVGVERFVGIPFAPSPTGERRFARAVESRAPFAGGVLNATVPGAPCIQNPLGDPRPPGHEEAPPPSEDCLFLNIHRPANTPPNAQLPVMVWAFGGGLCGGYASNAQFNASQLALQQGVIVVTVSYRLGALGFLPLGSLPGIDFDGGGSGGMNGLHDVVVGLRWVQRQIGAFGGRASDVTLFGESSGSYLSCVLSVSPRALGLFTRAALQSGPCAGGPPTPSGQGWGPSSTAFARNVSRRVLSTLNVSTLAGLRAVPAERVQWPDELMNDLVVAPYFSGYFEDSYANQAKAKPSQAKPRQATPSPLCRYVVDGAPEAAWKAGAIVPSALIVGYTSKDGTSAFYGTAPTLGNIPPDPKQTDAAAYQAALAAAWGKHAAAVEMQYPLAEYDGSPQAAYIQADADAFVICPAFAIARWAAQAGLDVWSCA